MEYQRNCPSCNTVISYSSYGSWWKGNYHNTQCRSCKAKMRWSKDSERNKQSSRRTGKGTGSRPEWWRKHISDSKVGHEVSETTRKKIAKSMRMFRLGKVTPCYNSIACKVIDEYGRVHGYDFQHAENGGEVRVIGYSLDGYDKERNVVIEVDEPNHKWKIERDRIRQHEIEQHLGCVFIRIRLKEQKYGVSQQPDNHG